MIHRFRWLATFCVLGLMAIGCTVSSAEPPANSTNDSPSNAATAAPAAANPDIVYLSSDNDLWIDKKHHEVVMKGKIAVREGNLEMLACPEGTKEHESIVAVSTKARPVHAALLALGARTGHPSHYDSKTQRFSPASGTEIEVFIRWTDDKGKHEVRGQDWIRNIKTRKAPNIRGYSAAALSRMARTARNTTRATTAILSAWRIFPRRRWTWRSTAPRRGPIISSSHTPSEFRRAARGWNSCCGRRWVRRPRERAGRDAVARLEILPSPPAPLPRQGEGEMREFHFALGVSAFL